MKALGITTLAAAAAKSLQLCLTLQPQRRQPTRLCRPWGSPGKDTGVGCHFLLQCMKVKSLSCVSLLATPWTAAFQAPPSMEFSRQEYWNGVPWPSPYYTWENLFIWFLRKKFICIGEGVFFLSLSLFTRWSMPKSDLLYSLQPKMKKLYTVSKKQDWELTVAQIMNSFLPNSDLNWRN